MVDESEPWELDVDEFLAEWEAADRQALDVLASLLAEELDAPAPQPAVDEAALRLLGGVGRGEWPCDYFVNALDWKQPPATADEGALLDAVASTISPLQDPGIDAEQQAAVGALLHADWLAIVVGLVRAGVGARFTAEMVADALVAIDEIEIDTLEQPDADEFGLAVAVLSPLWHAAGVLDEDDRLTEVGRWALPQALALVWSHPDEDTGEPGPARRSAPRLDEEQAGRALDLLAQRPRTLEELAGDLAAEGVDTDADQLDRSLVWRAEVHPFDDGVLAHLPTLADGVVLTHRLTAQERELGVLATGLDLDLFGLVALDPVPLAGGGEVAEVHRGPGAALPDGAAGGLRGPAGWLDGFAVGDLLGLRYDGPAIALLAVEPPGPDQVADDIATVARTAGEVARRHAELGDPALPGVQSLDVVLEARRSHPDLFRSPLPPLSELLADVPDIELEHSWIGVPGTAWHSEPDWLTAEERETYSAWRRVLRDHRVSGTVPGPEAAGDLARALTGRVFGLAALDLMREPQREPVAEVMAAAAAVDGTAAAVPLYLRARAAEGRDDGPAWASLLEQAVAAHPRMEEPTAELADLRALAGDAKEAHRLYGLAGFDTGAEELQALRRFLEPAPGEVGRNQPCPCGSGKKYKVCHGRDARHPLPDRAVWLWSKAELFARRDLNRQVLREWADLLAGFQDEVAQDLEDAPVTAWFALFDGGVLQRLHDLHGGMLPDDERALLDAWAHAEPRLLEVTAATAARRVTARDLVSGAELTFRDRRSASAPPESGDVVLCRLLDDGSGQPALLHHPWAVPVELRDRLVGLLERGTAGREIAGVYALALD